MDSPSATFLQSPSGTNHCKRARQLCYGAERVDWPKYARHGTRPSRCQRPEILSQSRRKSQDNKRVNSNVADPTQCVRHFNPDEARVGQGRGRSEDTVSRIGNTQIPGGSKRAATTGRRTMQASSFCATSQMRRTKEVLPSRTLATAAHPLNRPKMQALLSHAPHIVPRAAPAFPNATCFDARPR